MKGKAILNKVLVHLSAIILFLGISLIYFSPQMEGKVLPQGDSQQYHGASQELREYYNQEGESSAWTNSMFSGMPAYHIGVWGGSPNFLSIVEAPVHALGNNVGPVFTGMLTAYIMLILLGCSPFLAILGAIGYSLGSYNIIIIQAGHITKAWTIAYLPLILAGMLVMFKKRYITGGLLMALGLALQIKSNHLQVTYYTAILCGFIFLALCVEFIRRKQINDLLKICASLAAGVILALLCNMGNLYANYEMGQESIRGKSELTPRNTEEKQSGGLDKDYAFAWSYGKAETFSLLVPDIHGGASGGTLDTKSNLYKALRDNGAQVGNNGVQTYTYWGDQPFTSGPVYFGAIICFLFLLGMIVVRSNLKWYILAATIFFIFLSWGRHFDGFNDIMFHYLPFYNKFRTVSMALVIPAITMLLMAIWGLKEILESDIDKKKILKALYISGGVTAGLCLLLWMMPSAFFNFVSANDASLTSQVPDWYYQALLLDRKDLLSADALRSFLFIAVAFVLLLFTVKNKSKEKNMSQYFVLGVALLVLVDLWMVDKRYLNNDNFVTKTDYQQSAFQKSKADESILIDKSVSYRVLNTNGTFQETGTSYFHKSIGGYNAAKLRRYQELIDYHMGQEIEILASSANSNLQKEIEKLNQMHQAGEDISKIDISTEVFNKVAPIMQHTNTLAMMNAKYIIYHPQVPALINPYAMGNAWFVNNIKWVNTPDEEIEALENTKLANTAIVNNKYKEELQGLNLVSDSTASMVMTECKPNRLKYTSQTNSEQLVVLSEVYYNHGWQAYVDGEPASHVCANWLLRAMKIPAGNHEIEFRFEPQGYNTSRIVATAGSGLLILILVGSIIMAIVKRKEEDIENTKL